MSESRYQLAQFNIARLRAPLTDPPMAAFVENLQPINALADRSPGFVWRFQTEQGDATAERPYEDDRIIINFSIWEDLQTFRQFVYQSAHAGILKRRREWFEHLTDAYVALWWVPANHRPTVAEAIARLEHLKQHGPSPEAFTFGHIYPAPDASDSKSAVSASEGLLGPRGD
jgi:heme-degrading monooxygenase HmoA